MSTPGRSCPLHYRYAPRVFAAAAPAPLRALHTLYVVGGLYGNEAALQQVLALFAREPGPKRLLFNGDFHWFDADAAAFDRVQRQVLGFEALRGNVETELADSTAAADAGCGCAYPAWVGDAVVERSNRILARLRGVTTAAQRQALARLPMWQCAEVGPLRVGIVHGDAESLAGWGFAQEHLRDAAHRQQVAGWFEAAEVDVFASSHTCLPVFQRLDAAGGERWVLNNGAAGMPNFRGDGAGMLTRIALTPFDGDARRCGVVSRGVCLDLVAIEHDAAAFEQAFLRTWPAGSEAHASYLDRIRHGPDYAVAEVLRGA